jgi:hypothetical protein
MYAAQNTLASNMMQINVAIDTMGQQQQYNTFLMERNSYHSNSYTPLNMNRTIYVEPGSYKREECQCMRNISNMRGCNTKFQKLLYVIIVIFIVLSIIMFCIHRKDEAMIFFICTLCTTYFSFVYYCARACCFNLSFFPYGNETFRKWCCYGP